MNTMTQTHLEGLYMQMHRNQEGTKPIQKIPRNGSKTRRFTTHSPPLYPENSEKWIEDTALHNSHPHLYNLQGEGRLNQQKSASYVRKQACPERDARNQKIRGMQRGKKRVAKKRNSENRTARIRVT